MIVTINPSGSITLHSIIDGHLHHKTYYGYTMTEAIELFESAYTYKEDLT